MSTKALNRATRRILIVASGWAPGAATVRLGIEGRIRTPKQDWAPRARSQAGRHQSRGGELADRALANRCLARRQNETGGALFATVRIRAARKGYGVVPCFRRSGFRSAGPRERPTR